MVRKNNKYNLFYGFENGYKLFVTRPKSYLNYMEFIEGDDCKEDYKACGILDTYGNKFCFPKNDECPINEIIIDSSNKETNYKNDGYSICTISNSNNNFYYKRGNLNSNIVVYWYHYFKSQPKYIDGSNFILDTNAFEEVFGSNDDNNKNDDYDDDDDDDDDNDDDNDNGDNKKSTINSDQKFAKELINKSIELAFDVVQDIIKMSKLQKLINYINKKIDEDENNIDYNAKKINNGQYVKSYIGFKSINDINNFKKIDFSLFKKIFPNQISAIFSIICDIIYLIFLIIYLMKFIYKIKENSQCCEDSKWLIICSIIAYSSTFLGFYIYTIVTYIKVYDNEAFEIAKSIKAEKFIENFLKEFYDHFESKNFILYSMVFFTISGFLYIVGWILFLIDYCIKKKKNNNNDNNNNYNNDNNNNNRVIRYLNSFNNINNFNNINDYNNFNNFINFMNNLNNNNSNNNYNINNNPNRMRNFTDNEKLKADSARSNIEINNNETEEIVNENEEKNEEKNKETNKEKNENCQLDNKNENNDMIIKLKKGN